MNPFLKHKDIISGVKPIFEKFIFLNDKYPKVHHMIYEKTLLALYLEFERPDLKARSIYDFMKWLRELRKEIYSDCPYRICRKKTPKSEHRFRNMSLTDFMKYYEDKIT